MNKRRTNRATLMAVFAAGALLLSACSNPVSPDTGGETSPGDANGSTPSSPIIVSSANFISSEVVGNVYAEALRHAGIEVDTKFNIGSREAYVPALIDGSIDLIPDFTGNLLLFLNSDADMTSPEGIDEQLSTALEAKGLTMFTPAPAEDKDAMVVTAEKAAAWNLKTIADLAAHNDELRIAGAPEFKDRSVGLPGLEKNYGVVPKEFVTISDGGGPATLKALLDDQVDAANIYTGSASIPANNLVVLDDPEFNFPSQNIVPVINSDKATTQVRDVLDSVSAKLTTAELIKLNDLVTGDRKLEPIDAAKEWLEEQGLLS